MAKNYFLPAWTRSPSVIAWLNRTPEQKAKDYAAFVKFCDDEAARIDAIWKSSMCYRAPVVITPGSMNPFV